MRGGLPPGGHSDVVALARARARCGTTCRPSSPRKLQSGSSCLRVMRERHVEAVTRRELARVLDDDAHPAGELEVLQEERDLQGAGYRTGAVPSTAPLARFALGRGPRRRALPGATAGGARYASRSWGRRRTSARRPSPRSTAELLPLFVEFRSGGDPDQMMAAIERFAPDVVIVFRPGDHPRGPLRSRSRVPTLGFLTEPLPRGNGKPHPDLEWRLRDTRLIDRGNFDRIVSFDPLFVEAADPLAPVWRSVPLPVDDRFFAPVTASRGAAEGLVRGALDRAPRELPRGRQAQLRHPPRGARGVRRPPARAAARDGRGDQPPQRALPLLREPGVACISRPPTW